MDILVDLSEKREKMGRLSSLLQELSIPNELGKDIFFILGQNYIFGIEGKGLTLKDLISITKKSEYTVRKALDELEEMRLIEFIRRKPIEITVYRDLSTYFN
jgi:Fic family protein